MDETNLQDKTLLPVKKTCLNCESQSILEGFPNPLCAPCRDSLIKFPVPGWIKLFAIGIAVIFCISAYRLPANIRTGIHLQRGITSIEKKNFLSAQQELEKVNGSNLQNQEADAYLLIAAFHNQDIGTVYKMADKLKDKSFEDEAMLAKLEEELEQANTYFPGEKFSSLLKDYNNDVTQVPADSLRVYVSKNPDDIFAAQCYTGMLLNQEQYALADSVLTKALITDMDYVPALQQMSSLKRIENQLDESLKYCDHLLSLNHESVFGMASRARTLLKQKKDPEALELALKCRSLDMKDPYAAGTLLIAYHFTNRNIEKQSLLNNISKIKDSSYHQTIQYAIDVIEGKEFFRN